MSKTIRLALHDKPSPRVKIRLLGELGNQLFEWATGYAISRELGIALELQEGEAVNRLRPFALASHFETFVRNWWSSPDRPNIRSKSGRDLPMSADKLKRATRHVRHSSKIGAATLGQFIEPDVEQYLDSGYFPISSSIARQRVLRGYFQSWHFFDKYRADLLSQIRLRQPSQAFQALSTTLRPHENLAIHLRVGGAGKAVLNPSCVPPIDSEYLSRALSSLGYPRGDSRVIVFTDNPEGASSLGFDISSPSYVVIGPEALPCPCETLVLLSQFRGLIGSASTFSLWSAYLQTDPESRAIFPGRWLDGRATEDTGLMRSGWTIV